MNWRERFEKLNADGIDFVPVDFNPYTDMKVRIIHSYNKEEMLNGAIYPRSSYLFWKMIDGKKYYLVKASEV